MLSSGSIHECHDVTALDPDVVIIATGRLPNTELFESGTEQPLAISAWDIISGDVKPGNDVLIMMKAVHPGLMAAEATFERCRVEIMT